MKLSQITILDAPKKVLLFGPPKVGGKTYIAMALAEHFNLHYIGLEGGHITGKQLPQEWQERIDIVAIPDTKAMPTAYNAMMHLMKNGNIHSCIEHGIPRCPKCLLLGDTSATFNDINLKMFTKDDILIVDSATQLTNSVMAGILKGQGEDYKPEREDWRKQGTQLDGIFSYVQNSRVNQIWISHEIFVETEDEKAQRLVPIAGSANFSRNFAKYFDSVVYCEVKNNKHAYNSRSTYSPNILTGDRTNVDLGKFDMGLLPIFRPDLATAKLAEREAAKATSKK